MSKKYRSGNRQTKICLRCGYEWLSELEEPTGCPRCQSHSWNTPRTHPCGAPRKIPILVKASIEPQEPFMVVKHGIQMPLSDLNLFEQACTRLAILTGQTIDVNALQEVFLGILDELVEARVDTKDRVEVESHQIAESHRLGWLPQ